MSKAITVYELFLCKLKRLSCVVFVLLHAFVILASVNCQNKVLTLLGD